MADTTLTQTGAEVQADLDKVEGLANIKSIGTGLTLTSAGELSASGGGGTQLYKHVITFTGSSYITNIVIFTTRNTQYSEPMDFLNDTNATGKYVEQWAGDEKTLVPIIAVSTRGSGQTAGMISYYSVAHSQIGQLTTENLYNLTWGNDTVTAL